MFKSLDATTERRKSDAEILRPELESLKRDRQCQRGGEEETRRRAEQDVPSSEGFEGLFEKRRDRDGRIEGA